MNRSPHRHYRWAFQPKPRRTSFFLGALPFVALVLGMWWAGGPL